MEQAKETSGFLRLAQEYEAAFGREALERLIGEAVPDRQFEPGDLHQLLLELPWADVFTTNWDTLLERASDLVIDRKYDVIRMVADIPASMKPRIVKLHGTLSTNRPFVFTEEDFRRYPTEQAPFVNLAQQAMMENVFCLLGFSGDDPNFLYWTGWVRDHLGPYAPQIYLVGWLDLPPPRRRMLEDRGVIPIDCARLLLEEPWPQELRHKYAMEWFLWSLKAGEPYRLNNWPIIRSRKDSPTPSYLKISTDQLRDPRQESFHFDSKPTVQDLRDQIKIWQHNRRLYPGWLIAPRSIRSGLWRRTRPWILELLRLLPDLPDGEKLEFLEELNWRLEICLVPLSDGLPEAFEATLGAVDAMVSGSRRPTGQALQNENELRRSWLNIASALLRHAREDGNESEFKRWSDALLPHQAIWPELRSRLHYERCLLALSALDLKTVEEELAKWEINAGDSFWKVRKAGLLAESGRTDEAFRTTRDALNEIRQQTRKDSPDIPSLSREGWAMVLAQAFHFYPRGRSLETSNSEGEERIEKRWEVLRLNECDAWARLDECRRDLQAEIPGARAEKHEEFGFDPGNRRISLTSSHRSDDSKFLPAFQTRRLIEEVGLPSKADHTDLAKSLLLRTALWIAEPAPKEALGLILRSCDYDGDQSFNSFLTRNRIATLESSQVGSLKEKAEQAIAQYIPRAAAAMVEENTDRTAYWAGRLRVAVELLSRLALRFDTEQTEQTLQKAIDYCHQPLFQEQLWLSASLANLLSRTLRTMEPKRIQAYIPQFISLPLLGEGDSRLIANDRWPDPLVIIEDLEINIPNFRLEPSRTRRLIDLIGTPPPSTVRKSALQRVLVLWNWKLLTEEELVALGESLWRHRGPDGFPEGGGLSDFWFLSLPAPKEALAADLFRQKYFQSSSLSASLASSYLENITGAAALAVETGGKFHLSSSETEQISGTILKWWKNQGMKIAAESVHWGASLRREILQNTLIRALYHIALPGIAPDSPLGVTLATIIEDLRIAGFPVEILYPIMARLQPERLTEFINRLRQSLASNQRRISTAAVESVWLWLRKGPEFGLPEPPTDLVLEIALAISLRRPSCLKPALSVAEWILLHKPQLAEPRFVELVAEGLVSLLEVARYDAQPVSSDVGFAAEEISEVRARCAKVALAGTRIKTKNRPIFQDWVRQAETDPLPEVRHALYTAEATDVRLGE